MEGEFPRAISLFRTSQSYVAQARHQIPSVLAMVWFGVYAPGKRQREISESKRERERERERERHIGIRMFNV